MPRPCYEDQVRDKIKIDPRVSKAFLGRAKEHILSGKTFEETVHAMAEETGRQPLTVARIITEGKQIRPIMSQMWTQRANAAALRTAADRMISEANTGKGAKVLGQAWDASRRALTIGHGGVFPFTHMRDSLLLNSERDIFNRAVKRAYSYASESKGKPRWERDMTMMKLDPHFNWWEKRGLEIGDKSKPLGILTGKVEGWGARGFDAIKQARLELAKRQWENLPQDLQTKRMAELISEQVNHATGTVKTPPGTSKWLSRLSFAPKLYLAKKASAFVDPFKGLAKGGKMTPEERMASNIALKRWAKLVAITTSTVAANKAFNHYVQGKDDVNMTDPTKSDWMRMKIGGMTVPVSPMFEALKLPIRLVATMVAKPQKEMRGEKPTDTATDVIKQELQGVQHPSISLIEQALTGYDTFSHRRTALPGLRQLVGQGTQKETEPRMTALEQASGYAPMMVGGAVHQFYQSLRDNGMNAKDAMVWVKGLTVGALSGGAGIHATSHPQASDYRHMKKATRDRLETENAQFKWY